MAKVYYNKREHLVIRMNVREATKLDFGFKILGINNLCICGTCNNECKPNDIYYIAGINEVMCQDCIDDYCNNMNHYVDNDSLIYESNHFNRIAEKLGMNERAALTADGKCVIYNSKTAEEKQNNKDTFEDMTDKELIEYAQSVEADSYLSSMEAHDLPYIDCFL